MSLEETLRTIVRDEVRAAVEEIKAAMLPKQDADPWLTPKQAAEIAGVDPHTVYSWKRRGTIKVDGTARRWRVRRSELFKAVG